MDSNNEKRISAAKDLVFNVHTRGQTRQTTSPTDAKLSKDKNTTNDINVTHTKSVRAHKYRAEEEYWISTTFVFTGSNSLTDRLVDDSGGAFLYRHNTALFIKALIKALGQQLNLSHKTGGPMDREAVNLCKAVSKYEYNDANSDRVVSSKE